MQNRGFQGGVLNEENISSNHNFREMSKLPHSKQTPQSEWRISSMQSEVSHNPFLTLTYFQLLRVMLSENRLFFFHQFMSGNFIKQVFKKFGLACFCAKSKTDPIQQILLQFYSCISPTWLPNSLRPFFCGMFVPMLLLFYLNFQYLQSDFIVAQLTLKVIEVFMIVIVFLFVIMGLRTGGDLKTDIWRYRSAGIVTDKAYLKTQNIFCTDCNIIKPLRSHHCKYCNRCTPKYTKHSIVLNQCIGAPNQLLYMVFQGLIFIVTTMVLAFFITPKQSWFFSLKVFAVRIVFFIVNSYIQGMAGFQFLRGLLYTISYDCTEYEVNTWSKKAYLCTFDRIRFYNPFQSTINRHVLQCIYGFWGCIDRDGEDRVHNWDKTFYYYPSHLPKHLEHMQWMLYYQQLQEQQLKRYNLLKQQIQLIHKLDSSQFPKMEMMHMIQDEPKKLLPIVRLNSQDTKQQTVSHSSDDIQSISEADCRNNLNRPTLQQNRLNKSTM